MARKTKKTKAATPPPAPAKSAREIEAEQLAAKRHQQWAARHPRKAAEEQRLRDRVDHARADYSHKANGTTATHAHAAEMRQGALARLYMSGAIDGEQLLAGSMIALAHERLVAGVCIKTASLETRIDKSNHGGAFWESLGAVRLEAAYSAWRAELGPHAVVTLAVVVDDLGITLAARRTRMHVRKAHRLLVLALDLWQAHFFDACRDIDPATLAAAHAAIL